MKPTEAVEKKLNELAEKLLDVALLDAADEDAAGIFKAVTQFYVGATRVAGKGEKDDGGPNFASFRANIDNASKVQ